MRALLVLLVACSSWRQESSRGAATLQVADDRVRGAEVSVMHQINGVGMRLALDGQMLERDEPLVLLHRRDFGAGLGLGMSVSPLGLVAGDDSFTHWFDVGVAGSVGGGLVYPGRLTTYGQAWGGLWLAIGLYPGDVYPALVVEARRAAVSEWDNTTVFTASLALMRRYHTTFSMAFH